MSIHRKTSRKSPNIFTWIRQRTSRYDFGIKTSVKPVHCNKNESVKMHFQALRAGHWSRRLTRLKNADMADHFDGKQTYYFTADGRSSVSEVLINIDIDCHGSGTLDGALSFADHLRATRFPRLYFETSTNGKGVHGYILVEKGDLGDVGLNSALKRLDRWLKSKLSDGAWDVENVEVKGHAPEFVWRVEKYELKTYKSGQLAKLPREALSRANELRRTTRIGVDELRRLKLPSGIHESGDSVVIGKNGAASRQAAVERFQEQRVGSISGRHFGHDELAKLQGDYLEIATDLLGDTKLVAHGRKTVTGEDLAIFLMMLKFFTLNMNVDGTLSTARWEEMWEALYKAGDVDRAWCHHRYAAMRNYISRKDLLSWDDEGYVIGSEVRGRYVPGTAAKWRAGEELMSMLDGSEDLRGEVERGRSILYGCNEFNKSAIDAETIEFVTDYTRDVQEEEGEEGGRILYCCTVSLAVPIHEATRQSPQAESPFLARLRAQIPPQRPQFMGYSWQQGGMRMAA